MKEPASHSFLPLYVTNFFGVVNDNFLKTFAGFAAIGWIADPKLQSALISVTAGMLVVPYIVCSPLADRLVTLCSKLRIFRLAKWAELPIMAVAILGFALRSPTLVVASVLLMGLQSALYSPAKYALVRDVGGASRISVGMGWMEGITFLGVLAGTVAASFAADWTKSIPTWFPARMARLASLCDGMALPYAALVLFALLGLVCSYAIRADEMPARAIHSINPLRYFRRARRMAKSYPGLNAVIVTLSVFWWAAAMLQIGLLVYGKQVLGLSDQRTGAMMALAAVGIVAGQVCAGFVDRRRFLLGHTLLTGWIGAALLLTMFFVPLGPRGFSAALAALAFDFGFFKLPLDAEIQKIVKGPRLNTILAYFNQVSFFFMLLASGCFCVVSAIGGPRAFLLLLGLVFVVAPPAFALSSRKVMCFTGRWLFARRYDVTLEGLECLHPVAPDAAPAAYLVLPNHPAMVDPMLVASSLWETPLKPLSDESFFHTGIFAPWALRTLGAVAVPDLRRHRSAKGAGVARGLKDIVTGTLANGGNVIFYPSGHIQTEGDREEIGTRQLAYNVCGDLPGGVRVIGVRTTGLWGSIWSRAGRDRSPDFVPTLARSVLLWFFVAPFKPRRKVTIHLEDLTDRVVEWSALSRLDFNRRLESWYNDEVESVNAR